MDGMFFALKIKGGGSMTQQRKWFYGIFGALFVLILLFYGLILIFTYRGTPEESVQYFEFTQNIVHSRKRRKVG